MMDAACTRARAAGRMLAIFHRVWDIAPDSFAILAIGGQGFTCTRGAKGTDSAHQTLKAERLMDEVKGLARAAFSRAESPNAHGLHLYHNVNGPLIVPSWSGPDGHTFSPSPKASNARTTPGTPPNSGSGPG